MKTCFPIRMNGVCSANKNVLSKKIKLFSRQLLALLHNTTSRVSHKEKSEGKKIEALPVRQRHTSGPSPEGTRACQRGEQPGLLQKKKQSTAV